MSAGAPLKNGRAGSLFCAIIRPTLPGREAEDWTNVEGDLGHSTSRASSDDVSGRKGESIVTAGESKTVGMLSSDSESREKEEVEF